jgi:hypothetical protein
MLHEDYFAFLTNYFSSIKVTAQTLLGMSESRMESLLSLLAVVLAVSFLDFVSGYYDDVHRLDNCPSYTDTRNRSPVHPTFDYSRSPSFLFYG